jgi:hypothetical protein
MASLLFLWRRDCFCRPTIIACLRESDLSIDAPLLDNATNTKPVTIAIVGTLKLFRYQGVLMTVAALE